MRRLVLALLATSGLVGFTAQASAADISRPVGKAPIVEPIQYFSWTGFYLGAHVGYGWAKTDWSFPGGATSFASHDTNGFLAGGQIGFNYQFGQWVLGIEADGSWTDMNNSTGCLLAPISCSTDVKWMALVTGRLGWAAWDRALLYVKGGAAFADHEFTVSAPVPIIFLPVATRASDTRVGWTIGAGLEYAFAPNWSAKIEYNFIDFGSDRMTFTDGSAVDIDQHINVVKFGINYRFGAPLAPVSARY